MYFFVEDENVCWAYVPHIFLFFIFWGAGAGVMMYKV